MVPFPDLLCVHTFLMGDTWRVRSANLQMFIATECALLPMYTICDSHLIYYIHVANACDVDSQANTLFPAFVCIGIPCRYTRNSDVLNVHLVETAAQLISLETPLFSSRA